MPEKTEKAKTKMKIITSPEGIPLDITRAKRWKFKNAMNADRQLPKLMKQVLEVMIDHTDEGYNQDARKHGYVYLSPQTIAQKCGCTVRAVWTNLAALENGETEKGKKISDRWQIRVRREGERGKGGGRNKPNWYFLLGWHEFGAVEHTDGNAGQKQSSGPFMPAPFKINPLNPREVSFTSKYGSFTFFDESNGDGIGRDHCMSLRQQFIFLCDKWERFTGLPAELGAWDAFATSGLKLWTVEANFEVSQGYSFEDCVSRKLWDDDIKEDQPVAEDLGERDEKPPSMEQGVQQPHDQPQHSLQNCNANCGCQYGRQHAKDEALRNAGSDRKVDAFDEPF